MATILKLFGVRNAVGEYYIFAGRSCPVASFTDEFDIDCVTSQRDEADRMSKHWSAQLIEFELTELPEIKE